MSDDDGWDPIIMEVETPWTSWGPIPNQCDDPQHDVGIDLVMKLILCLGLQSLCVYVPYSVSVMFLCIKKHSMYMFSKY